MSRRFAFGVSGLQFIGDGKILVAGLVHEGPLRTGDSFTRANPPGGGEPIPVGLRVDEIRAYGTVVRELPKGLSGGLVVPTGEESKLTLGCVLSGEAGC